MRKRMAEKKKKEELCAKLQQALVTKFSWYNGVKCISKNGVTELKVLKV